MSKTFVLGLVPTPNADGSSNFDDEGRITKEKENVLATPDLESWFTQHLHQVVLNLCTTPLWSYTHKLFSGPPNASGRPSRPWDLRFCIR